MNDPPDSGPRRGLLPRFTLKDGNTFLLADALGDVHDRQDGLFTADTRILLKFELSVASRPVSLLGAAVSQDHTTFIAHPDLALLTTPLPTGPYPYAGIPWFSTQFGRDAIITARQTLWLDPQLAAGVLRFLPSSRPPKRRASVTASPARSCTRCAAAKWPICARFRLVAITAAWIRRHCL
jgi:hypothetical protein